MEEKKRVKFHDAGVQPRSPDPINAKMIADLLKLVDALWAVDDLWCKLLRHLFEDELPQVVIHLWSSQPAPFKILKNTLGVKQPPAGVHFLPGAMGWFCFSLEFCPALPCRL